ncbi:hypothetical protein LCGC14_3031000, partial [marine sediment metagenome]
MIKFLSALMIILMLAGCSGCMLPMIGKQKVNLSLSPLFTPKPAKTAVIVQLFGEVSEEWTVDVEKALQNPRCSLVVLWIESPGGSVTETKLLTHKLKVLQRKYNKPIYVYSERILASGAYWVASAFEKIVISPAGYAGSIGVYMIREDYSGLYDMLGLKYHYIASDSTKVMGNNATPMKDWERGYWQWTINNIHIKFLNHIWSYRSAQLIESYQHRNQRFITTRQDTLLAKVQFRQIANGTLYNSKYAISMGLIDSVLYFDKFVKFLQEEGFIVMTTEEKMITDFYPFNAKKLEENRAQKTWDHLQV